MNAVAVDHRLDGPDGAPVVVLSNSIGSTPAIWERQRDALAAAHRVLTYDHRGHGASPVPPGPYTLEDLAGDLLALLDRLEIERASLCGVSLGGMVALWIAQHAPERVERLVLCCTSACLGPPSMWAERAATAREPDGMATLAHASVQRWFTPAFTTREPELVARVEALAATTDPEGYAGCCAAIQWMDLHPRLADVVAPTLVIAAEHDPSTPPPHGRLIADGIPGARFALVPAAHQAQLEQPERVTRLILDHLETP